jgi:hypothetical protein
MDAGILQTSLGAFSRKIQGMFIGGEMAPSLQLLDMSGQLNKLELLLTQMAQYMPIPLLAWFGRNITELQQSSTVIILICSSRRVAMRVHETFLHHTLSRKIPGSLCLSYIRTTYLSLTMQAIKNSLR